MIKFSQKQIKQEFKKIKFKKFDPTCYPIWEIFATRIELHTYSQKAIEIEC